MTISEAAKVPILAVGVLRMCMKVLVDCRSRESAGRGHESVIRGHGLVANAVKGLE